VRPAKEEVHSDIISELVDVITSDVQMGMSVFEEIVLKFQLVWEVAQLANSALLESAFQS
jgi:hypothetical protein